MESYFKNLDAAELEKARMVIGQFITSCSHSMRGPLKSINGLVALLHGHKSYSPEEVTMFLNLISSSAEKMERILDELEHFLENSKRDVLLKPIDCRELLSIIMHQFTQEIDSKKIALNITVDQPVLFYSDAGRLRIILTNLITNAIQFQDKLKSLHELKISIQVNDKHGVIAISDNGIGMDPAIQPRIFELFFRATEQSPGTGIGLYVVYEAVKKIGGKIKIDSVPKEGTVITVTLPNLMDQLSGN